MHGWSGRGSQLGAFAGPLVERGYSVVTWDGLGHGDSPGGSSSLVELADASFAVSRSLRTTPHAIVAHSMGAGAAAVAMAEGLDVNRAAWIAPPASLLHFVRGFHEIMGFSDDVGERITREMNERYSVDLADYDVEAMRVPHGERVLVIHDADDREVPIEHGRRVARVVGAAQFIETEALGHRRILRDSDIARRVTNWIADSVEPVGS